MEPSKFKVRNAKPNEFKAIGNLMVTVYSQLDGFPKPEDQPDYYNLLMNIGEQTKNPHTELLVAISQDDQLAGAVLYFSDMAYYGSGGSATRQKNASGFRLLAVDLELRGKGIGKLLSIACIKKAKLDQNKELIIHTTNAMKLAWGMYERLGFKRSKDLDFMQKELPVFGFRLNLSEPT